MTNTELEQVARQVRAVGLHSSWNDLLVFSESVVGSLVNAYQVLLRNSESTDNMLELRYTDRKRVHNLKYYTWVEQQGKTYEDIQAQWYEDDYWTGVQKQVPEIDELIVAFNERVAKL